MKKKVFYVIIFAIFIMLQTKIYGANMSMSISKSSAYVGDTFTVTISGVNGKVNISGSGNITLNKSGVQWIHENLTITGTAQAVGTGQITVIPIDLTTDTAEPEEVTAAASRSIKINEKETPVAPPTTQPNTPNTPDTPVSNTNTKPTTANKKPSTDKKDKDKKEENKEQDIEQNLEEDFIISKLSLKGIKENGEKVDIQLSPEFNSNTYEYTCNVLSDIKNIELEKDAGKYTDSIIVTGLEELKEGENVITLQLVAEGKETKSYTIKVIKEEKIEETEVIQDKEETKTIMVSMPLWLFIIIQIVIIILEVVIIYFIIWKKFSNRENNNN